ncbi:tetraacyldisaccharide 4'-kinase [Mucilaginibacter sp. CSA2-8R]|uniref:tetraacyldisaccharide 4'-kinase n=1 Tax=Mucilaginibacter sp. CSA2-8R TaxID=3141542 RepID=UPI00315D03BE
MLKYLRWLLFPFSLLYGLVVVVRNWFYDAGLFKSRKFELPVICVGNLDVGGAGKSPMTEYLVRLLKSDFKLATLSRGYGRQSKGFWVANNEVDPVREITATAAKSTATANMAAQLGDEPSQFAQKFPDVTVAVCEKRVEGIERLQANHDLIILDDAYQHRAVEPGFSVLLFDYSRINEPHLLLPAGNLREPFVGRYRADVFVVSKCPPDLSVADQHKIITQLKPLNYQQVYFTAITYLPLQWLNGGDEPASLNQNTTLFLITGIANARPLLQHLGKLTTHIVHHNYADHHQFSLKNIAKLAQDFNSCTDAQKVIITTEKDAQRLRNPQLLPLVNTLPIMVLPIGISFLNGGEAQFNKTIFNYVRQYTTHRSVH